MNTLPSITFDGSPTLFNGYPYDLKYTIGFGEPSKCIITFVNENGVYTEPVMNYVDHYNIELGTNKILRYYASSYEIVKSAQGKTLQVTFVDKSKILDRYHVGLYKRIGNISIPLQGYEIQGNLIIVGKEIHPCDASGDGVLDETDIAMSIIDPCDPCSECPPGKNLTRCDDISCSAILEVAYNFNMLLGAMGALNIPVVNPPETNDYYLAEYDGTLRDVLQAWGADYGFTFVWTEDDKLQFVDLTTPTVINESIPRDKAAEIRTSKSIEETESRAIISYYARNGERKKYTCAREDYSILHTLTLEDFYPTGLDGNTVRQKEEASALAHFSEHLRDAYWWYHVHGVTDSGAAVLRINNNMPAFGDMKILKVISHADTVTTRVLPDGFSTTTEGYRACTGLLENSDLFTVTGQTGYFFVAESNNDLAAQRFATEQTFGNSIMGQYWYRHYTAHFCGGGFQNVKPTVVGPDSSEGGYSTVGEDIPAGLPFTEYNHQPGSTIDKLLNDDTIGENIIYIKREAKWSPNSFDSRNAVTNFQRQNDIFSSGVFRELPPNDLLIELWPAARTNPNIKLCIGYPSNMEFDTIEDSSIVDTNTNVLLDGTFQGSCGIYSYGQMYYGLMSRKCVIMSVRVNNVGIDYYTPSQAFGSINEGGSLGYKAQVQQTFQQDVFIPKVQTKKMTFDGLADNAAFMRVNARTIENQDIIALQGNQCVPSESTIQQIHENFNVNLAFDNSAEREERQITVYGIDVDTTPTIADGLIGMDISLSAQGIKTTYSFANKPKTPPRLDVVRRNVERDRKRPMSP